MSEIRVLEIFREPIANGGQESFIMNMYRNIDRKKVQFDFLTPFTCDNKKLKEEVERLGGRIYHYDHVFGEKNNKVFKKCVSDFLRGHHYDTVHFHSGSTYALMEGSKIAHDMGVKNIIVHSHCGGFADLKYHIIKALSVPYLMNYPTDYFACSHLAAKWKFPAQIIRKKRYKVIKNAIDTERFCYLPEVREKYRKQFCVEDRLVVGHIGRFEVQKNHKFILEVFQQLHRKNPKSDLFLIGEGELRKECEQLTEKLGIQDSVHFLGLRSDIPELLNMMDLFLMPSFFEGLPVVGVEAQATGLPVYLSDSIAKELPVKDLAFYLSLKDSAEQWAECILQKQTTVVRRNTTQEISEQGYEIKAAARQFENYYLFMNGRTRT